MLQTLLQNSPTGQPYWLFFIDSVLTTIICSAFAAVFATLLATILASLKNAGYKSAGYFIETSRNIPLIVHVFFAFYVLPVYFTPILKLSNAHQVYLLGFLALTIYSSGRIASQLLSSLQAIAPNKEEASKNLGLSKFQTYRYVLLPISFRTTWPTLSSEWVAVIKNSSVLSTIGLVELTKSTHLFIEETALAFLAFGIGCSAYILINTLLLYTFSTIYRRIAIKGNL